jgi:hypothetical protein
MNYVTDRESKPFPEADYTPEGIDLADPPSDAGGYTFDDTSSFNPEAPAFNANADLPRSSFPYYPADADQQLQLPANDHFEALFTNDDYLNEIAHQGGLTPLAEDMGDDFIPGAANRALVDHLWPVPPDQSDGTYDVRRDAVSQVLFGGIKLSEGEFFQSARDQYTQQQAERDKRYPDWIEPQDVTDFPELALKLHYINQGRQEANRASRRLNRPVAELSDDQLEGMGRTLEARHHEQAVNFDDPTNPLWDTGKLILGGAADGALAMVQGTFTESAASKRKFRPNDPEAQEEARQLEEASAIMGQMREGYAQTYKVNPEFANIFLGRVLSAVGQTLPYIASLSLGLGALVPAQAQGFQYAWDDAKQTAGRLKQPFDPNRAYAYATVMGTISAALNLVKVNAPLRPWLKTTGPASLKKSLLEILRATTISGTAGAVQGGLNDEGATLFGIENRNPFDPEKRGTDFLLGAATGTVLSLTAGGAKLVADRTPKPGELIPESVRPKAEDVQAEAAGPQANVNATSSMPPSRESGPVPSPDRTAEYSNNPPAEKTISKSSEPPISDQLKQRLEARSGEPFDDKLDQMYRDAARVKPQLDKIAREIAEKTNGTIKIADLKGRARAVDKIKSDYKGNAADITDIARVTIISSKPELVVHEIAHRFKIGPIRDTFGKPTETGYQDAMFKVPLDGIIVEIQVHDPNLIAAKEAEHPLYVKAEGIRRKAKRDNRDLTVDELNYLEELNMKRKQIYNEARSKHN